MLPLQLISLIGAATSASGTIILPSIISNGAVLQREANVAIWGQADAGEIITVNFNGQSVDTTASNGGDWELDLLPMIANSTAQEMTISGSSSAMVVVADVRVGEVWFGSGQSNMQRALDRDLYYTEALADLQANIANYDLHFFDVTKNGGNIDSTVWETISESSASSFSAIMYYFGRELTKDSSMTDVPIGLITSAVGATAIEKWATCAGPGSLYTGQVKGLQPYVIHGIIWYQGEWDARGGGAENYYWQLECLIEEWRTDWRLPEVKFYIVQMPKMGIGKIHVVRDAELHNYLLDDTVELIVSIDFEDGGDAVHPPKEQFGKRLSNLALMKEYGQPIEASSPVHNENLSYADGPDITVFFNHTYGGLLSQTQTPEAEWEVSDGGNSWYPVTTLSIVDGDKVVVLSDQVSCPVKVRYAFSPNPVDHDLVNSTA